MNEYMVAIVAPILTVFVILGGAWALIFLVYISKKIKQFCMWWLFP